MSNTSKRVVFALTSHDKLGTTGNETGYYVGEAAHPWKVLTKHGYDVDFVSIQGGAPPTTGYDADDDAQREFLTDPQQAAALAETRTPADVDPADYAAILYVGGHGAMWDFPDDAALATLGREIYEHDGIVAAVCHGPAGLVNLTLSDGSYLIEGKDVAGFTNGEETAVKLTEVVPFLLEDKLEGRGAKHTGAANFEPYVVVSGRLVTGQNPASATGVGEALAELLDNRES